LQSIDVATIAIAGCELLTIFYLYKVLCSTSSLGVTKGMVVNCLQFFIFTRFFAVHSGFGTAYQSCELLTIFYLYKVLCSPLPVIHHKYIVVNCLQFFIFTRFFAVSSLAPVDVDEL